VALATRFDLRVTSTLTNPLDLETPLSALTYNSLIDLATGTGLGQADMKWSDQRTLVASGTEDLDLAGSLTGPLGTTLTFARVKALLVKAASANTNDVQISRAAAGIPLFAATGDLIPVKPGGLFLWVAPNAAGVVVTPATADTITITNSAGTTGVTYDIVIIGASA
jgi:hypothetical protein